MICPQCGKHYSENESVCRLCAVPLQSPQTVAAPVSEPVFVRPPGLDQTLQSIRRDINSIDQRTARPAGFFIRVLASCIDNLLVTLLSLVVAFVSVLILKLDIASITRDPEELTRWLWLLLVLPNTMLSCMYFIYFHAVTGQTVGKLVCGVQVLTADGHRLLGWRRSIVRCLGYFLCSFFFFIGGFLGFVWVLFNRRKRGWHDYLAGSVVIYKEE